METLSTSEVFKICQVERFKQRGWKEIADQFNSHELFTPTGKEWTPTALAALFSRMSNQKKESPKEAKNSLSSVADIIKAISEIKKADLAQLVSDLNEIKLAIHEISPFNKEPVDCVVWIKNDLVESNDYNPNSVAPPEMELLHTSISHDGYTQPIVTNFEDETYVVIDGFHRNRVAREYPDIAERLNGYLPVVQIRDSQSERPDRIASTIRHNRARGKHRVEAMSDIVLELKRRNWSDKKIGKELGMDPDEVLRLAQITGLAEAFADREFSQSWEAVIGDEDLQIEESELDEAVE